MLAFRLHQSLIPWEKPVWFLPLFMLLPAKRRRSFQALFIVYFKMTSDYLLSPLRARRVLVFDTSNILLFNFMAGSPLFSTT